jgi:hypothetical protein
MRAKRAMPAEPIALPECCQEYTHAAIVYRLKHDKYCPHYGSPGQHCFRKAKRRLEACPQHQQWEAAEEQELDSKLRIFRSGTDAAMAIASLAADISGGFSVVSQDHGGLILQTKNAPIGGEV